MSRIHEALKRAEEERTAQATPADGAASAVATQAARAAVVPAENFRAEAAAAPGATFEPASDAAGAPSGALTAELLQERFAPSNWSPDPAKLISFNGSQPAVGTEEFRTLRSHLYRLRAIQPLRTVLVTSALAGEGKTFVASNLAQTLAQHRGRRVLLVDADLRKPSLHEVLGLRAAPGVTEYLCGEKDELAVLQRPGNNLFFIPGGKSAINAAELIANGQLGRLLARVAPAFDWVVIDSPPWALVSDASVIADMCDGVLLVVQAGSTPVEVAQKVRQQLRSKRLLGVALNQVDKASGYTSYYYTTYGTRRN